jgi:dethiobiotin synthetase
MNRGFFVSATDTGVGKTLVTALIACALRARGVDAGVIKPFATGCRRDGSRLVCEDADFLRAATGVQDEEELVCPARWEEPLAPLMASERAGDSHKDWLAVVREAHAELARRHECVIVEGVGGWLVPLIRMPHSGGVFAVDDLAVELNLPVVLVARRTLGTLNHTALSLRSIHTRCRLAALVFCDAAPVASDDVAAQSGPGWLCENSNLALHHVPFEPDLTPGRVQVLAAQLDWPWLDQELSAGPAAST